MDDSKAVRSEIEALADILDEKGLTEIECERAGLRIRVRRVAGAGAVPPPQAPPARAPHSDPAPPPPAGEADGGSQVREILSPMVGTYYAAPSPESKPYVKVGDRVGRGQVVCIIEAMKLMNEIESEFEGEVLECPVANSEPVEYGQPLLRLAVD